MDGKPSRLNRVVWDRPRTAPTPALADVLIRRFEEKAAVHRALAQPEIWRFAETYRIHGEAVDGMDVLAVHECVARAVEKARRESAPTMIEARTYRSRGHSVRDPAGAVYRTREEVDHEKQRDPIVLFGDRCLEEGAPPETDIKNMQTAADEIVEDAVAFADASPEPPAEWLMTDVIKESADALPDPS